jgi:hypothetical protein
MMPRHRKEGGPRHGTLRRETNSRRSVLQRVPTSGRGTGRAHATAARRPRLRLARSLLATPWFAAGAGIVIAAVLAVDSPAALTYGPTFPGERCPVHGCGSGSGSSPGQAGTATPSVQLKAPGLEMNGGVAAGAGRHGRGVRGTLLGFQVVRRWPSGFLAVITIPRAVSNGSWSLRFAFPAAHVDRVWGALWQPSDDGDGGMALALHPRPGPSSETPGREPDTGRVTVSATGTPTAPSGCVLDGANCRFG